MTPSGDLGAAVGIVESGNSVVMVTVNPDGKVLDRRSANLTEGLPTHPYHHQGSWAVGRYLTSSWAQPTTLLEAIKLVQQVTEAASHGARDCLEELQTAVARPIAIVAIRVCPELPVGIEDRIRDNRAQVVADSVLYRQAIAAAAITRGWKVVWYDRDSVLGEAGKLLDVRDVSEHFKQIGRQVGPPWQSAHKLATAAAIVASRLLQDSLRD